MGTLRTRSSPVSANNAQFKRFGIACGVALALFAVARYAWATRLTLKDGRQLEGAVALLTGLADNPSAAITDDQDGLRPVVLCNDNLRRYYVPKRQVQSVSEMQVGQPTEEFKVWQNVAERGLRVASVGAVVEIEPFDEHGRRKIQISTGEGPVIVVQGITEISPLWTRVQGLQVGTKNYIWDQRIATSSISKEVLDQILHQLIDEDDLDQRLKIVRFYVQCERYKDAQQELELILAEYPDRAAQFARVVRDQRQAYARRILTEIEFRREAGQHVLSFSMLQNFPSEDVAGETLQAVRTMLGDYQQEYDRGVGIIDKLKSLLAEIDETALREQASPMVDEIAADLNLNTLPRMAAFSQFMDDEELPAADRVALAISGWLIGADAAERNFPVAVSLAEVRRVVREFLTEPVKVRRMELLQELQSLEGAAPRQVARLLAHLKPPLDAGESVAEQPGMYALQAPGLAGQPPFDYVVQLPPEYDPYRHYPAVVTLHAVGTSPEHQIDWWAGPRGPDGMRLGQGSRRGYIVIAPAWLRPGQREYGYSGEEHAAVLYTLRDACRRFSIDTDRVFLSGHSTGGNAAWDLGIAHPDLWAGVIPISARADRYVTQYWENARHVPLYLVGGELDSGALVANALSLDRYFTRGYNTTVVEFLGRGHEHFSDEVLQIFDWMARYKRNFFPQEFECTTMRPWDNYFWWVELDALPPKTMVDPLSWPPPRGTRPARVEARVTDNGNLLVTTGAKRVTLWLSPQLIDFDQRVQVVVNGERLASNGTFIEPDLAVILEDARSRGDRQQPFWAMVEMPSGKINGQLPE